MKKDVQTTTSAFKNLFSKEEVAYAEVHQFKFEDDSNILVHYLSFAESLFPHDGIMLCPVSHSSLRYVGSNCERIFGHSRQSLQRMLIEDYFSLVHEDDLPAVRQCLAFIRNLMPYDPEEYRFVSHYRVRNHQGEYLHIRDEKLAIKTANNTYLNLMLFSNVTSEKKFYHVTLDVFRKKNGQFVKSSTYNPQQKERRITPRQNDIARLILQGLSNQEIADRLSVSIFTVKNHKKMLFKKTNVRNSIELANYVRQA
jgi:DNA-binding CsgD family transcriptional regulator